MEVKKYIKQIVVAVAAFVLCIFLCLLLFNIFIGREKEQKKYRVEFLAENEMEKLENILTEYEQIPHVWSGIVKGEDGEVRDFDEISRQLYEKDDNIKAIQLAPGGVIEYCYPNNFDVLGHDLLNDDARKNDALEAKETGEYVISGPFDLVQGGKGIVIRYPIYLEDEFWGFSVIVLNTPDVFEQTDMGKLEDEGYVFRLVKDDNGEESLIMGEDEEISDSVEYELTVGRRNWRLSLKPANGWIEKCIKNKYLTEALIISILVSLGVFLLGITLLRNKELKKMKYDLISQTKALAASEKANRMQSKALDASKKANEMQAEALEASKKANLAQIEALEMAKSENMRQAEALEASEAANRAKTEFISRISHDIRTPIGAIKNLTEFAMKDLDDKEKLKSDLEKIDTSNKFLLSLINDVLDISRVDSGKIELSPEPYPYEEYSNNIKNIMEPMCSEKNIKFEMLDEYDYVSRGVIVADKIRINQIVLNILSNAVKYTPEGGSVTYISKSKALDNKKILYSFTVKDTGIGMSEEFQKRMFNEFSQEYNNPDRQQGMTGTGLGLSIVKKMVDLMGGTIEVKSKIGEGSEFTIAIEFDNALEMEEYADKLVSDKVFEDNVSFNGKILVVEDNFINREIARRMFEECGLTVDMAEDGVQGRDMFSSSASEEYKAIFMDIQMPNMNGYEATAAIRAMDRDDSKTIPIIAMTADAFDEAVKKAKDVGMNEYVTKPLNLAVIKDILKKIKWD